MSGSDRKGGFYTIEGKKYPSVTTILRVISKPALIGWLQKQAAEKALSGDFDTPEKVLASLELDKDTAGQRGTDVHRLAQWYAENEYVRPTPMSLRPDPDNTYWPAIVSFFQTMKPEVRDTELTVFSEEHGYAGTLDLLARIEGRSFVIDWKTSKAIYPEFALQVRAYQECRKAIGRESVFDLSYGETEAGAVVLLRPNGTFTFNEVKADLDVFLAAKKLWMWQTRA